MLWNNGIINEKEKGKDKMIDIKYNEIKDRNSWIDGNYLNATICVTEDCNLRCTYCYMVGKNNHNKMNWKTGKEIIDFLLDNPYTSEMADSIMLDFIGGEPLLEMELIDKMCDYFILRMYAENHKWFPNYVFTFSTNGVLYGKKNVRDYVEKHGEHCAFSISIDGTKEKHDMTRKKIDGSGSYDDVIKNLPIYMEENYNPSTKSTFSSEDLLYLKDSIIHLWDLGFKDVESNLVYENVWKQGDAEIFEQQLKELADYMFESGRYKTNSVAYFSPTRGLPVGKKDLASNRCGAGYKTLAFDYKGDIYPCIRFLEMCAENHAKRVIGNIKEGVNYSRLRPMAAATWEAQSPDKCNTCECGTDCGWCLAHNLSESNQDSVFQRCTYICEMHKANSKANKYYWQKYEEVTGYTSSRTVEKIKKIDTRTLKYLYIITEDNAPAHCNYRNKNMNSKKISKEIMDKALKLCRSKELIPIFQGKIPEYVDMRKQIFFEISNENSFKNPVTGITVIDDMNLKKDIMTAVVTLILNKNHIEKLAFSVKVLFDKAKRINIFISDLSEWNEQEIVLYKRQLKEISEFIFGKYKEGNYGYQINILTDRLYSDKDADNDCGAGSSSIAVGPNGKLYVCPAFYFNNPDKSIGDLKNGLEYDYKRYLREKSAMCSKCKSEVCNRYIFEGYEICGELNVPSDIQCQINYIEANESRKLMCKLNKILPLEFHMNRDLPNLEYIDYVAAEIYRDERAEAKRWMY